jgi:hypothetical protein
MTALTKNSVGRDGPVFPDRRGAGRRRVLKGARLSFNKGYAVFECVVRNMSDCGARLSFGDAAAVPSRFELLIWGTLSAHCDRPLAQHDCARRHVRLIGRTFWECAWLTNGRATETGRDGSR